jgi:hypothetical protein
MLSNRTSPIFSEYKPFSSNLLHREVARCSQDFGIGEQNIQFSIFAKTIKNLKKSGTLSNTNIIVNGKIEGAIGINAHNELWYTNAPDNAESDFSDLVQSQIVEDWLSELHQIVVIRKEIFKAINHKVAAEMISFVVNDQGLTWENEDQRVVAEKKLKNLNKKMYKTLPKEADVYISPS